MKPQLWRVVMARPRPPPACPRVAGSVSKQDRWIQYRPDWSWEAADNEGLWALQDVSSRMFAPGLVGIFEASFRELQQRKCRTASWELAAHVQGSAKSEKVPQTSSIIVSERRRGGQNAEAESFIIDSEGDDDRCSGWTRTYVYTWRTTASVMIS